MERGRKGRLYQRTYSLHIWSCLNSFELCKYLTHSISKINERGTERKGADWGEGKGAKGFCYSRNFFSGLYTLAALTHLLKWFAQPHIHTYPSTLHQENPCGSSSYKYLTCEYMNTSPRKSTCGLSGIKEPDITPKNWSFMLGINVVGENWLLWVVFWPQHALEWLDG